MYTVTLPLLRPPMTLNQQRRAHSLVKCGYFANDDSRHVLSVTQQIRIDRERPRIVIELEEEKD